MNPPPRSVQFRKEREDRWLELESLVDRVEKKGPRSLSPGEMTRLPTLYRSCVSSLSVARAISLDRSLLEYLESLVCRSYLCVYGVRHSLGGVLANFVTRDLPRGVRRLRWHLAVSALVLGLGTWTGFALTRSDPARFSAFVPGALQQGRGPLATRDDLEAMLHGGEDQSDEMLWTFAIALFRNNASVGLLCFVTGILLGVPVLYLLFTTGLMLGAFAAVHHDKGLGTAWWGWVMGHGVSELGAVVLCAAAGLALGQAVIAPGPQSRARTLARQSRNVSVVVLGAVGMFVVAGVIEGVFRQRVQSDAIRYAVAAVTGLLWLVYFTQVGRERARE